MSASARGDNRLDGNLCGRRPCLRGNAESKVWRWGSVLPLLSFCLTCLVLLGSPEKAPGETPGPPAPAAPELIEQAKQHFDAGNAHYAAGRYQQAVQAFQAGYALVPRPSFLLNLGQAYRRLGNLPAAKDAYVAYLQALPEESPLRNQALQVLAEIEVRLQENRAGASAALPEPRALSPARPGPDLITPGPPSPSDEPRVSRRFWGVAAGVTGLALLGTGTVFELRARGASQDLSETSRNGGTFDSDKHRIGRRDERLGVGFLIAGTVLTAAGVLVYTLIDDTPQAAAEKLAASMTSGALAGGVRF